MKATKLISLVLIFALIMPTVLMITMETSYAATGSLGLSSGSGFLNFLQGLLGFFFLERFVGQDDTEASEPEVDESDQTEQNSSEQKSGEEIVEEENEKDQQDEVAQEFDWTEMQVTSLTTTEREMLELVNQERKERGLNELKTDYQLVKVARAKSQDMIDEDYFTHQSPNYGSPFDMLRRINVSYNIAGENLAGASRVELAHQELMNSPGHKENILHSDYTHVGIGVIEGGSYGKMYTQIFANLK
ncbi:CAP domain-containing protein [Natroniella sulfidigena]|uniref:CAP domain-containing protein n=1 Tax=Natroniella sulfidigena TaxID=723921 RepID=UPI00200A1C7B|nr:CAP domain-containing protein [Natroniella sulfidigena]MCK8817074.1 CAP domain-containing protein [Natroniella sulfidigena]